MTKNLGQLFKEDAGALAPADLAEKIYLRIDHAAAKSLRRETFVTGAFFVFSLAAFIGSAFYSYHEFAASNFGSYFSLIFSDGSTAMTLWKDLGLSLVESLPLFGVVILLASVVAVLWSLRKFTKTNPHLSLGAHTLVA